MNMIAENIARRRKELGMTQKELAERLNISDKTLSRWETEKQVPDALMIPEIARALDMSIAEIYGIADAADKMKNDQSHETGMENDSVKEEVDYARITSYKIVVLAGAFLLVLGGSIYSFMGVLWNYMKFGALVLLIVGLSVFLIGELTFEEFYQRKDNPDVYQKIHKRWFGIAVPLVGLLIGIVLPAVKAPVISMFNNWDAILPLMLFQGCVLGLYRKDRRKKTALHHIFLAAGTICIIGFLINATNNPYRYMGGFTYEEWELETLWGRIKFFELASGFALFCMNVLHSKDILGIYGKVIKKVSQIIGTGILIVSVIAALCICVMNKDLQSRVTYTSGEVSMDQLTDYSYELLDWIQECNLSGKEICIRECSVYGAEGEILRRYLIYLPHGCKDTELEISYRLGWEENILKIEAENTTPIADDTCHLCYLEVSNHGDDYKIETYIEGERITYKLEESFFVWNVFE